MAYAALLLSMLWHWFSDQWSQYHSACDQSHPYLIMALAHTSSDASNLDILLLHLIYKFYHR